MGRTCINDHRPEHSLGDPAWHNGCAQCEIERLRAERDALRADAERYRKLRDSAFVSAPIVVDPLNMSMVYSGDSLDAALDALPGEAHD